MRDNQEMWRRNLVKIFLALRQEGALTKNGLCQRLDLSRPTVDRAISHLMATGFVHHDGRGPSAGGRRAILYAINPHALYTVGSDLEFPELNLVIVGLDGDFTRKQTLTIPAAITAEPTDTLAFTAASIEALLADAGITIDRVAGLGIGVPAFLIDDTITMAGHALPHWEHVPVREILATALSIPVFVSNDVKFMSLAEHRAMGYQDRVMAYLALRRGLKGDIRMGGSILINGKLFHGGNGNAGALYHAYVEEDAVQKCVAENPDRFAALLADRLFEPVVNLLHLFDPNRVVINAATIGDDEPAFIQALAARLNEVHYEGMAHNVVITGAHERELSCAKGGALFALEKALQRPIELIT